MPTVNFEYKPLGIHAPMHQSPAYERALFGAFGSGKTYGLCAEGIALGLEQPGSHILIARKTVPELRDTTEAVFFEILPHDLLKAEGSVIRRSGGHVESYTMPNGSKYIFRQIDDWKKLKSLNLAWMLLDEADEFDEETYLGMQSRIRQTVPLGNQNKGQQITRRGTVLATNPAGHDWLFRRFIDPATKFDGTAAFRSTSFDNPFLPKEFIDKLLTYPDQWIKRYVLCQFDDFAGQVYEEWNFDQHVIDPIPRDQLPRGAVFWMGMDPGTQDPTAGLWAYVDQDKGRLVGVAEYQHAALAANVHAASWRAIEANYSMKVSKRVADPTIMTRDRGTNNSLHGMYARLGYNFQLGPKEERKRVPVLGQLINMGKFVVTKDCPMVADQISSLKWKELTPQQRAAGDDPTGKVHKSNSHLVDCAQYLAASHVRPAKLEVPYVQESVDSRIWRNVISNVQKGTKRPQQHDLEGAIV